MMKIVPDPPPAGTILKTVTTPFGSCDAGHEPLFAVRGGINAEDALVDGAEGKDSKARPEAKL
ncbi:hypothetical protein NVV94_08865 [Pseudomonas sp. LS1212]|uniref:hypothetical protein n=1 Tax=Pseudomonas sp. LS1212 TaxID=2972478 RepID=UPI00215C2632|nr:hypothetical protein [Pseudomonas sp. LS1212]UVJ46698.1 hypothetical protein NVV94_08865 [Pseudomonas sp. LS1212]